MNCPELAATELGCVASDLSSGLETGLQGGGAQQPTMCCHYAVQIPDDVDTVDIRYSSDEAECSWYPPVPS
jgi:hypothetical protein